MLKAFDKIYLFAKEEANITLQFKEMNIHKSGSMAFYVNYVGPLQGNINSRDVKIDITRGETLEYDIKTRKVFSVYSDLPKESFTLQCYSLSEVLIEKMTALMGRMEPRDLYDFWYLTEHEGLKTKEHKLAFERKAMNKKHNPDRFQEKVLSKKKNLKQAWIRKLENQVQDLPKFEDVFREAKKDLKL